MDFFKRIIFTLLFSISLSYGEECSPIPKDETKLPASLEKEIKAIANLCELDTLEKKVRSLERSLKKLERCIPHYKYKANDSTENFNYLSSIGLWEMHLIYDGDDMQIYWRNLFNDKTEGERAPVLREYLNYRAKAFGIRSDDATNTRKAYTTFKYNWEHDVYRGFYCMSYINPPPPYKRTNN